MIERRGYAAFFVLDVPRRNISALLYVVLQRNYNLAIDRETIPKLIGKKSRGIPSHLVLYFRPNKKAEPLRSFAF